MPVLCKKAPLITYLSLLNFVALTPEIYDKTFPNLLTDKTFTLYMVKQFVRMSSIEDKSPRYKPDPVLQLFPGEKFKSFYEEVQKLAEGFLNGEDKMYMMHFLKITIDDEGNIRYLSKNETDCI